MNGIIAASRRIGDNQPPSVPTGLNATSICQTTFTLNWSASTDNVGVTGYRVYKNGVSEATLGNVTSYNVTGQSAGATNTWTVSALDAAGNESSQSSGLSVTQSVSVSAVLMSNTGQSTQVAACGESTTITRYVTGGNTTPDNGETVYNNSCASNVFVGGNLWYTNGSVSFTINNSGVVSNSTIC